MNTEKQEPKENTIPLLPLRDIVIFPGMMVPLFVGRPKSKNALEAISGSSSLIMLSAQKDPSVNDPEGDDIYRIGCVAEVAQTLKLPDGATKVLVEGKYRAKIDSFVENNEYLSVNYSPVKAIPSTGPGHEALFRTARSFFEQYAKLNQNLPSEMATSLLAEDSPEVFTDMVAANLGVKVDEKQQLLEAENTKTRLELLVERLQGEIEILQIEKRVRSRVKKQMEKSQRDYYLTEQMKAIQKELGRVGDGEKTEFEEFREKIEAARMPSDVKKRALKELTKLEQMPPMSAEGTVSRNYIDWLVEAPWSKKSKDKLDIKGAAKILEEDHYGLDKVKDRILEYLSVRKLVNRMKGPVICFVGPPGVGKTSLGRSIARAMGRKFVRFSLGGVRDEAEIRGHRRTYVGALPGRIVQSMKKAGTKNPVIMLDEIDKVASDFRGDPAAALLEALDPEQNVAFNDHYLEVDYDLSEVMFITTANVLHTIPRALRDRMEVITISGYTDDEKEKIARRFLLPKQETEHGLPKNVLKVSDEALLKIIRNYTRESGVRNLERELASVARKVARKIAESKPAGKTKKPAKRKAVNIGEESLADYLGEIKYRDDLAEKVNESGITTGLAWTEVGGAILKIETTVLDGKGKYILTGKLGDVMKESAQAALSYIRSRSKEFGLKKNFHSNVDIHIHIPEGAIPKDGPSAGITIATSMVSALLKKPVRHDVAMTGEITLRGHVLPIGGLKEKLLASVRAGIDTVLIPKDNEKDLKEIPDKILNSLKIVPVDSMDEVLKLALAAEKPKRTGSKKKATKGGRKITKQSKARLAALSVSDGQRVNKAIAMTKGKSNG